MSYLGKTETRGFKNLYEDFVTYLLSLDSQATPVKASIITPSGY
jgi:hypothetical protein